MVSCIVATTPAGWYVTFPADPSAGLLLNYREEKQRFARDCGIDLDGEDLLLALDLGVITQCPEQYFFSAQIYREIPYELRLP
jgi:hypothetical protein